MSEAEKKSWFGGVTGALKGAFVEDVPETSKEAPKAKAPSTPNPVLLQRNTPLPPPPAVLDKAVRDKLEAAVAEAAPPGYAELHSNLSALAEDIPDESARFRAAVRLALRKGHTVEGLLNDVDKCLGILETKKNAFEVTEKKQVQATVASLRDRANAIEATAAQQRSTVAMLQNEISAADTEVARLRFDVTNETNRISAIREGFLAAYSAVQGGLSTLRAKIETQGKS